MKRPTDTKEIDKALHVAAHSWNILKLGVGPDEIYLTRMKMIYAYDDFYDQYPEGTLLSKVAKDLLIEAKNFGNEDERGALLAGD